MEWMAEIVFVRCVFVCVCVQVQRTGQSDQFKTVKATYGLQIWHACFQGQSGHDPLKFLKKGDIYKNSLGGDMHSKLFICVSLSLI